MAAGACRCWWRIVSPITRGIARAAGAEFFQADVSSEENIAAMFAAAAKNSAP